MIYNFFILLLPLTVQSLSISGSLRSRDNTTKAVYLDGNLVAYTQLNKFTFSTNQPRGTLSFYATPSNAIDYELWEQWSFVSEPILTYRLIKLGVEWESEIHSHDTLVVSPVKVIPYFVPRESFSPLAMLGNPMVLMMVVSLGLMVFMQFAMPSADTLQELQQHQPQK